MESWLCHGESWYHLTLLHQDVKYCYSSPLDFTINSSLLHCKIKILIKNNIHQIGIKALQLASRLYSFCVIFQLQYILSNMVGNSWLKSHNQRVIISYGINLISNDVGIWSIIIAYEEKTLIKMHSYKISKASEHQKTVFLRNYQWNDWLRISILSDFYPIPTVRFTSSKKMFHIRYSI